MADKAITELVAAEQITATDLFVLQQNDTAKKLPGQVLLNWLTAAADGHGGIQSYDKLKTEGLVKTYRFTLADQTHIDIDVVDGRGINAIEKVSTSGLVDTYRIRYNDNTTGTFTVTNGAKGDKGDNTYIWIKYASQEPTAQSHSFGDVPDAWIGVYFGPLSSAPDDWQQYSWYQIKGEKGEVGDPATLISADVTYQSSTSGTVIPSGTWTTNIPTVQQGHYLWTRVVQQFNTGGPVTAYSVSRMGLDGLGSVVSVAGVAPDPSGNVPLTADHIKALPISGGTMTGPVNMNGQKLSGLNSPSSESDAATMGFVNSEARKAAPYNYAHNSNFEHFIAQAGLAQHHDVDEIYVGDRWILVSGTVTGKSGENGYEDITLKGTIRQVVENPPETGTVAVNMISGTADISYQNGEITIASDGGVIKNVRLFSGIWANVPDYKPKGYTAELSDCKKYFQCYENKGNYQIPLAFGRASSTTAARVTMPISQEMQVTPGMIKGSNIEWYLLCNGSNISEVTVSLIDMKNNLLVFDVAGAGFTKDHPVVLAYRGASSTINESIKFCADL